MDNLPPSTEISDTESEVEMTPERRQESQQKCQACKALNIRESTWPLKPEPPLIDTRPIYLRTIYFPSDASNVLPEQNRTHGNGPSSSLRTQASESIPPTKKAAAEELTQKSIDLDHNSRRLIRATSAEEDQVQNVFPLHFPPIRHVQNYGELGSFVDRAKYAICIGAAPLEDLQYGIIIVPVGEEHILFRSDNVSREVPLPTQPESSPHSVNESRLRMDNSWLPAAALDTPEILVSKRKGTIADPSTSPKDSPSKGNQIGREGPTRVTKTPRTGGGQPRPMTPSLEASRRSPRLKGGKSSS